ncbi:MAG TPA: nitrile hydratase accessory protein [Methylomirabilota bacterium]|jgi:nitrile hydratase accessory protein|nr:nitrile hydratase accessory protein [Methylomirabilota bacterium]
MTTSTPPEPRLPDFPALPRDDDGPVFRAPWEAQAFALAVKLHEAGCFTWREWAERLAAEIQRAQELGDPDLGTTYYEHWLAALERIVAEKGLVAAAELVRRKGDWETAARQTPPGKPIELRPADAEPRTRQPEDRR